MTHVSPSADVVAASPPAAHSVSVLRWDDELAVAALLARAFLDDPLVTAICDASLPERQHRMQWSFRVAVRSHCLSRQPAWTLLDADGQPLGVVLVTRPQVRMHSQNGSDLLFVLRGFWHLGWRAAVRGIQAAQEIAARVPPEPFTYLRTLGVDPEVHGRGLGSQLVEQVVRTAPAGVPIYLETAKERNLSFYTRHGFECIGDFPCLGVPVWRLLRAARA